MKGKGSTGKGVLFTPPSLPQPVIFDGQSWAENLPIYKGEIVMKMKNVIKKESHRFFKKEYLERSQELEMKRREIYKELRSLGTPSYKAFQLSLKRMKI
jgi:hypothetical protein|tara:strand:+ start:370 stop:666 length:297 start_codon:yes stop_codon:yes gene_type:complete